MFDIYILFPLSSNVLLADMKSASLFFSTFFSLRSRNTMESSVPSRTHHVHYHCDTRREDFGSYVICNYLYRACIQYILSILYKCR